jgi:hydroxymethylpyrimidine pyrophosphatase-like HAD family hydrolase
MFDWAGCAFVMENAPESVKAHNPGFIVAPPNSDSGVARVLEAELKGE